MGRLSERMASPRLALSVLALGSVVAVAAVLLASALGEWLVWTGVVARRPRILARLAPAGA